MKLVSWNCQGGFINKDKYKKLLDLNPDIAIVQECSQPNLFDDKFDYYDVIWRGNNENKGLCVISFSKDLKFTILEKEIKSQWIIPIKVTGKSTFILLAVWVIKQPSLSYGKYLFSALKEYEQLYKNGEVVIMGDFNVDQKLPSSYRGIKGLTQISEFLRNYQIHSCYHVLNNEDYGQETKPTYYHHRKPENPFHIDYSFVSQEILNQKTNFLICDDEEWSKWSDHFPLVLETNA